jgi:hypothetical protein
MFSLLVATAILFFLGIHFLPAFVAMVRHHRHAGLIFVLNIFIAWTVIGWLVLLIWAAVGEERYPLFDDRRSVA